MVKNPPYNAGGAGWIPGQGTKIPHVAKQLRYCVPQQKIPYDAMKVPQATTKTLQPNK